MANYVFDEGAALMATTGLDWENTVYEMLLYQDNSGPFNAASDWASANIVIPTNGVAVMPNRSVNSVGACDSDNLRFNNVELVAPGEVVPGLIIRRQSDNLLIVHIDEGLRGIDPFRVSQLGGKSGGVLSIRLSPTTYNFWVIPDSQNRSAWFRP